ncbi:alpha-2-macroglobulin-like protein 1 [Mixophyes fleayi]|uniref:alpha-2-macroglobulin-like protein 1 n=1 Tax=Mixophyes fleayi TaxID=3061075 RepID=UPI003F4E3DB1
MQLLLVTLCLAIYSSAFISASEPHYLITVPAQSVQGSLVKACVIFLDLEGVVNLKLDLHKDEQVLAVVEHKIDTANYSNCFSFQAPGVEEEWIFWHFHVSAQGEHINVNEKKKIAILKGFDVCLIQTDRATYKPGDTVRFRLVAVDHNFHAAKKTYALAELKDPNSNRIAQWLNVSPNHGIADFSFHLAKELSLGEYTINIPGGCAKEFTVSEYVHKRFEIHLKLPDNVAVTDKSFHLESCGRYTYGKPVQGSVDLTICPHVNIWHQNHYSSSEEDGSEKCMKINGVKTDNKGCLSREINLSFFNASRSDSLQYLNISSSLTEDGTGHIEKSSAELRLKKHKKIKIVDIGHFYYKGFPLHGKVHVFDEKNQPMVNEVISLSVRQQQEKILDLVTDKNGFARFTLNTSTWDDVVQITAAFPSRDDDDDDVVDYRHRRHSEDVRWLFPFYSESDSFLNVESTTDKISCGSDQSLTVKYYINKNSLGPESDNLSIFYLILSKIGINSFKEYTLDITDETSSPHLHGSFSINMHVDADLSLAFTVVVFSVLPKGETIVGAARFQVSDCSENKVQLSFSKEQVRPREKVNLKLTAESGSWCSVRSVDKGFLLHKPHEDSSYAKEFAKGIEDAIYRNQYSILNRDSETHQCPENETAENENYGFSSQFDASHLFKLSNLKVITNTRIKKPVKCVARGFSGRSLLKQKQVDAKGKDAEFKKQFPRGDFPDTWLYDLVSVGPEGHTQLHLTTPDSITKWETDAFCLGKSGLGEVKDVGLTTFKPYFIELILPYSVVQGENFTIQAIVFSYVEKCMLVVVSLSDSEDFTTVQSKDQARCVCEDHSTHFKWDATVLNLKNLKIQVHSGSLEVDGACTADTLLVGTDHREDSIEKTIVVKARGHEEQKTETFLLYPADTSEKIQVSFQAPDGLVKGSQRAHIIVLGDLMGNIVINLDNMLNLPEGCGEQNLAKLCRYAYTLQYLQSVKELTPEIKEKAMESLIKGYQKQLTFKNVNGSYGVFPVSRPNFWVTVLAIKAFSSAQNFIYIDEIHIQQAVKWLQEQQLPNGSFDEEGKYFNNKLEAENEVAQTAFVAIALLEHHLVYNGSIVENALNFLRKAADNITSVYTQALLAYVFTLSGDSELRQEALKHLDEAAVKKDGSKYWKINNHGDVETTSYVLLALLCGRIITQKDLEESADIVRWTVTQQTPQGGFYSSQDTTVALQALSLYAKATYHKKGDATVTVESKSGFHKEIHVDKSNSLIVQTVDLPEIPGEYTVTATGQGCVYVQSHLHYNSLPVKCEDHFSLNVSTNPAVCTQEGRKKFEVHVDVSYSGKRKDTNMAIITIELLSGYVATKNNIKQLNKHPTVKRTEVCDGNITIYLDKLTHKTESFSFELKQETHVTNLQPANVLVYDYYDPGKWK